MCALYSCVLSETKEACAASYLSFLKRVKPSSSKVHSFRMLLRLQQSPTTITHSATQWENLKDERLAGEAGGTPIRARVFHGSLLGGKLLVPLLEWRGHLTANRAETLSEWFTPEMWGYFAHAAALSHSSHVWMWARFVSIWGSDLRLLEMYPNSRIIVKYVRCEGSSPGFPPLGLAPSHQTSLW